MASGGYAPGRGAWHFQLRALYDFLAHLYGRDALGTYRDFRGALYRADINTRLRPYGARVVVAVNRGKVDENEYALIWGDGATGR